MESFARWLEATDVYAKLSAAADYIGGIVRDIDHFRQTEKSFKLRNRIACTDIVLGDIWSALLRAHKEGWVEPAMGRLAKLVHYDYWAVIKYQRARQEHQKQSKATIAMEREADNAVRSLQKLIPQGT